MNTNKTLQKMEQTAGGPSPLEKLKALIDARYSAAQRVNKAQAQLDAAKAVLRAEDRALTKAHRAELKALLALQVSNPDDCAAVWAYRNRLDAEVLNSTSRRVVDEDEPQRLLESQP